ncbi:nuclear transport factor 2 family protein [Ferrimonas gelatinilytica]|uniref:Nuclear transport factor 2 family protein n=1 Tax=Ferrimonas gelatinilytica TaxID=1255257 RepID=A0ABP9S088_9GAMM
MSVNPTPHWLNQFALVWNRLNSDSLAGLSDIYHPELEFRDPSVTLHGLAAFKTHLAAIYQNAQEVHFDLGHCVIESPEQLCQTWQMQFRHPKLAGGRLITVDGISELRHGDGGIFYHRDYFDLGAMLYEHLPLIGAVNRRIKKGLAP